MPDFILPTSASPAIRQGASGLGLEAQRAVVLRHIATGQLAGEDSMPARAELARWDWDEGFGHLVIVVTV